MVTGDASCADKGEAETLVVRALDPDTVSDGDSGSSGMRSNAWMPSRSAAVDVRKLPPYMTMN